MEDVSNLHSSEAIGVVSANQGKALEHFIAYPYDHYRHHPYWAPPLRISERARFDPTRNPFYQHARMELFLAWRGDEVVGRIAAIDDDNHNRSHGDNIAFFGFFEARDAEVANALLHAAETWAKSQGRDSLRGPANPSMNDGSGFQISGFAHLPFVMTPYNPPEYAGYAEQRGYYKVKDLYAWSFDNAKGMSERINRIAARLMKRYGVKVRTLNRRAIDADIAIIKHIYNEAWQQNWGFVRYTDAEFDHLAAELKLIIDPDLALFLEIDGEVAAIAIGLPDINQLFKRIGNGRLVPRGWLYLLGAKLWPRRYIDRVRLPILGVMPQHRRKGLEAILIREIAARATAKGYAGGECSWVLEDNEVMNKETAAAGAELYKIYRLYQKDF